MTFWCVHDVLVCAWRFGVCMTFWCVHDVLVCAWRSGVCMTFWCVHDVLVCAWRFDVCMTFWCVHDVLVFAWRFGVCMTFWCVHDVLMHDVLLVGGSYDVSSKHVIWRSKFYFTKCGWNAPRLHLTVTCKFVVLHVYMMTGSRHVGHQVDQ